MKKIILCLFLVAPLAQGSEREGWEDFDAGQDMDDLYEEQKNTPVSPQEELAKVDRSFRLALNSKNPKNSYLKDVFNFVQGKPFPREFQGKEEELREILSTLTETATAELRRQWSPASPL